MSNRQQELILALQQYHWSLSQLPAADRIRCRIDNLSLKSGIMKASIHTLAENCNVSRKDVSRVLQEDEGVFYRQDPLRESWYHRINADANEFEMARLCLLKPTTRVLRILLRIIQGSDDFSAVLTDSLFEKQGGIGAASMRNIRRRLPEIGWFVFSGQWRGAGSVYQWNGFESPKSCKNESPKNTSRKPQKHEQKAPKTRAESPKSGDPYLLDST